MLGDVAGDARHPQQFTAAAINTRDAYRDLDPRTILSPDRHFEAADEFWVSCQSGSILLQQIRGVGPKLRQHVQLEDGAPDSLFRAEAKQPLCRLIPRHYGKLRRGRRKTENCVVGGLYDCRQECLLVFGAAFISNVACKPDYVFELASVADYRNRDDIEHAPVALESRQLPFLKPNPSPFLQLFDGDGDLV